MNIYQPEIKIVSDECVVEEKERYTYMYNEKKEGKIYMYIRAEE